MSHPLLPPQDHLLIDGGVPLSGEVRIPGAKNAALPAVVAACLSATPTVLRNVPVGLADMRLLLLLLRRHGAVIGQLGPDTLSCDGTGWRGGEFDSALSGKLRHVLLLLGLSAHRGRAAWLGSIGGCALGERKHDFHATLFRDFGYRVADDSIFGIEGRAAEGTVRTRFPYPSFGATLNFLFAAVGRTGGASLLENAALNPEVQDVIALLRAMGADITWTGQDGRTLRVVGNGPLRGTSHTVMGDRIVAATVAAAAAATAGSVSVRGVDIGYLQSELAIWRGCGVKIRSLDNGFRVDRPARLLPADIETRAYPAFHTDMQPLHGVLMCLADGTSRIRDTILDSRFKYVAELVRMGADAVVEPGDFTCVNGAPGRMAVIRGPALLTGATVAATDIRGGAALVVAALAARGRSRITNLYQIDRGYDGLESLFASLGNPIRRVTVPLAEAARELRGADRASPLPDPVPVAGGGG